MPESTGDLAAHDGLAIAMVQHVKDTATALGEMAKQLAVMNERTARFPERLDDHETRLRAVETNTPSVEQFTDHERRVRELERSSLTKKAAYAAAVLLIPFLTAVLAFILGKVFP